MKVHAILLTRDAEDVIEQNLAAALHWADSIYVQDTGSVDRTPRLIQSAAQRDSRVVVIESRQIEVFHEGLRSDVFNAVRDRARDGDWFVHLDEDEFFHQNPRTFVQTLPDRDGAVWSQLFEFRLMRRDVARLTEEGEIRKQRAIPLIDRQRYYNILEYSEPRMFRYRESMVWTTRGSFPHNAGYVSRKRIAIRHYPHRDPIQLRQRLKLRHEMRPKLPPNEYHHWKWTFEELIAEEDAPGVYYWEPGTELPAPSFTNHLLPWPKRMAQRLLHTCGVRTVDRLRTLQLRTSTQE